MRATLFITVGAYAGRKIVLRDGEIAQFGRTEWSDYSFPGDSAMADRHFRIQCAPRQCLIQDLQSHSGTRVDGREVTHFVLRTGNIISAGQTMFAVVLGDDALPAALRGQTASPAETPTAPEAEGTVVTAVETSPTPAILAKRAKLSKQTCSLARQSESPAECAKTLLARQAVDDALGLVAVAMPPLVAFDWAIANLQVTLAEVKHKLDPADASALDMAMKWREEPSDELALQCEQIANTLELETPAAWAAFCAYFANDNLTPGAEERIAPAPGVCGNAARTCLLLASALLPPNKVAAIRQKYVADALNRLEADSH